MSDYTVRPGSVNVRASIDAGVMASGEVGLRVRAASRDCAAERPDHRKIIIRERLFVERQE
jgi:hypothetical protein